MSTATRDELLAAYDAQLRTDAEASGADAVVRLGPLHLVTFAAGRGLVTYADLDGAGPATVRGFVAAALAHFRSDPAITEVEWKTRGHDRAPGLDRALTDHGFVPGAPESIMVGPAAALAVDVPLPDGVTLRRVTSEADVRATAAVGDEIFGDDPATSGHGDGLVRRLARDPAAQLWVAEAAGRTVATGRLEPVAGTQFAGLWGGGTRPEWRGRGIYRALTAVRAREALAAGAVFLHSDSTELSRPILERSGLVKVSTTTPYTWARPRGAADEPGTSRS